MILFLKWLKDYSEMGHVIPIFKSIHSRRAANINVLHSCYFMFKLGYSYFPYDSARIADEANGFPFLVELFITILDGVIISD